MSEGRIHAAGFAAATSLPAVFLEENSPEKDPNGREHDGTHQH
jgi:hypothetical protein